MSAGLSPLEDSAAERLAPEEEEEAEPAVGGGVEESGLSPF